MSYRTLSSGALAASALLLISLSAFAGVTAAPLKSEVVEGEPIFVRLTFSNPADKPANFDYIMVPTDEKRQKASSIAISDEKSNLHASLYCGYIWKYVGKGNVLRVALKPGQTIEVDCMVMVEKEAETVVGLPAGNWRCALTLVPFEKEKNDPVTAEWDITCKEASEPIKEALARFAAVPGKAFTDGIAEEHLKDLIAVADDHSYTPYAIYAQYLLARYYVHEAYLNKRRDLALPQAERYLLPLVSKVESLPRVISHGILLDVYEYGRMTKRNDLIKLAAQTYLKLFPEGPRAAVFKSLIEKTAL